MGYPLSMAEAIDRMRVRGIWLSNAVISFAMAGFVLTDGSPLMGLARVDGLQWLQSLLGTVWMPAEVRFEVVSAVNARGFEEEASILHAPSQGWLNGSETEVFARLHRSDFRISAEVIRAILKRVGESYSSEV